MSSTSRLCIIFDAHAHVDRDFLNINFGRIFDMFSPFGDVVAVFDEPWQHNSIMPHKIELCKTDIFHSFEHSKGDFLIPGNVDLKIVAAVSRLKEYTHFIRVEFDVWPTDSAKFRASELCRRALSGSFGASFIRDGLHDPDWIYWPSLMPPNDQSMISADRYAAFLPLMFFPRSFIEYYAHQLGEGWQGHYEALMPTLAHRAGLKFVDLGESGLNLTYVDEFNVSPKTFTSPTLGSFVHPVKSFAQVGGLKPNYKDNIVASASEISEIQNRMQSSNNYLEFGAGGTTLLACESGVQNVTSIETDLNFCSEIVIKYNLRTYIDSGRLHLQHVHVGRTGKWGYPLSMPSDTQIENYISWPHKISYVDLILIDGRFRVAVAADAAMHMDSDATIMIHDYFNRPQYKVVEEFLSLIHRVDNLAIFHPMNENRDIAKRIRQEYFYRMD